jgi:hypothetical protein
VCGGAAVICGWLCRIRVEVCGTAGLSTGAAVARDRATSAGSRLLIFACVMSHRLFDAACGFRGVGGCHRSVLLHHGARLALTWIVPVLA